MTQLKFLISIIIGTLLVASTTGGGQQATTISDRDIKVRTFEPLRYPVIGRWIAGAVVVRITTDPSGKVSDAAAVSGDPLLVGDATENAKKWRFEPNGEHAAIVVYLFRIEGVCKNNQYVTHFSFARPNLATITTCRATPVP